jgi:hypothetical protein
VAEVVAAAVAETGTRSFAHDRPWAVDSAWAVMDGDRGDAGTQYWPPPRISADTCRTRRGQSSRLMIKSSKL